MKYLINCIPLNKPVDEAGQWTVANGKWARVVSITDDQAMVFGFQSPLLIKHLCRFIKVLVPSEPLKDYDKAITVPDQYWDEFISEIIDDNHIKIIKNDDGQFAIPKFTRSALQLITASLAKQPDIKHDDMYASNELAANAVYMITRNIAHLGKVNLIPQHRNDEQTIKDLTDAAVLLINEIDRILRK